MFTLLLLLTLPLDPPGLAAAAEAALAARFPEHGERLAVRVIRTGGDLPEAPRFAFGAEVPRGHAQVDLLDASGRRAGWAFLYVAHYDSVVVATTRLRRDEPLAPGTLRAAWVETTRLPGDPLRPEDVRALDAAGGAIATRLLSPDRPLRRGDLRGPFAAAPGDPVTLTYERSGLTLALQCRAREGGHAGDAVRLHCPETGATYRARLTAPGSAAWLETLRAAR